MTSPPLSARERPWWMDHLQAWACRTYDDLVVRDLWIGRISAYVLRFPDVVESPGAMSWPEIRSIIERNDHLGIGTL